MFMTTYTQVVIIGAGYSGIAAAKKLFEENNNIEFVILEAQDRIGGRVKTITTDAGLKLELGAQWIGPEHLEINKWVQEADFSTFDTYDDGEHIFRFNGGQTKYKSSDGGPGLNNVFSKNLYSLMLDLITWFAKKVCAAPMPNRLTARILDRFSVSDFFAIAKYILSPKDVHGMLKGYEASSAQNGKNVSTLHALHEIKASGSFQEIIKVRNGAQQSMISEGAQRLVKNIATPFEDRIMINHAVKTIHELPEGCTIGGENFEIKAKKVIVAIPPVLAANIHFYGPKFPERRTKLLPLLKPGKPIKCFAIYETPFWRDKGFSGQITSDHPFFILSYDCSPPGGKGVLLFFAKDSERGFMDLDKKIREQTVVEEIVKSYGEEGREILEYHDHIWNENTEPWSQGGYAGAYPPQAWTQFKETLRKPSDHIHWAGTETAEKFYGYMEGAILAGYRAADEVITAIEKKS
jgi:monoamine oxidase